MILECYLCVGKGSAILSEKSSLLGDNEVITCLHTHIYTYIHAYIHTHTRSQESDDEEKEDDLTKSDVPDSGLGVFPAKS